MISPPKTPMWDHPHGNGDISLGFRQFIPMKRILFPQELAGMREAHLRDGLAMAR
eukprot:CAMPEP_0182901924 /NCGR_PEP_ID=MMETSP0034_2-20130328/30061_1 /TAXON_ID=156128 /ORGANISM="Nephroselmis pyriformis, Strain CCMP717" /LENGTH=54 /DNA_ID=CAMNT_0025036461 /DNA_START=144 /DNA_END=304 /DNA_ORIENTATION=-